MQSWKKCDQIHLCYEFNELLSGKNTSKTKTNELKELVFFFFFFECSKYTSWQG